MKIIDKISKEKLAGYFAILWGASFILTGISNVSYYATLASSIELQMTGLLFGIMTFTGIAGILLDFAMGIVLVVLGFKLIRKI